MNIIELKESIEKAEVLDVLFTSPNSTFNISGEVEVIRVYPNESMELWMENDCHIGFSGISSIESTDDDVIVVTCGESVFTLNML